jgi:transposase
VSATLSVYAVAAADLIGPDLDTVLAAADAHSRRRAQCSPWTSGHEAVVILQRRGIPEEDTPDGWWGTVPDGFPSVPDGILIGWRSPEEALALADRYAVVLARLRGQESDAVTEYLEGIDAVFAAFSWLQPKARAAGRPEPGLLAILR